MSAVNKIAAREFCSHHHVEVSFLHSLHEYGLIEIVGEEEDFYVNEDELDAIEKIIRLHYDLHINLEGIDAVQNLLQRIEAMQAEIVSLKNRLYLHEEQS